MRQYLKLFKENHLLTKQEIIYSIDKYTEHCKEAYNEEGWSAFWIGRKALMIKVGKSFLMEFQVRGVIDYERQ